MLLLLLLLALLDAYIFPRPLLQKDYLSTPPPQRRTTRARTLFTLFRAAGFCSSPFSTRAALRSFHLLLPLLLLLLLFRRRRLVVKGASLSEEEREFPHSRHTFLTPLLLLRVKRERERETRDEEREQGINNDNVWTQRRREQRRASFSTGARFVLHVRDGHLPEPDRHVRRVHQNASRYHRGNTEAVFGDSLQPVREVFATAETLGSRGFGEQRTADVLHQTGEGVE